MTNSATPLTEELRVKLTDEIAEILVASGLDVLSSIGILEAIKLSFFYQAAGAALQEEKE